MNVSFQLPNTSENVVRKILSYLNTNKVVGMDQIPTKFLKAAADTLAYLLAKIINLSVKTFGFPEGCKPPKLKTLFQEGSKTDPKNYRPISPCSVQNY